MKCKKCGQVINWPDIVEKLPYLFNKVDRHGPAALSEVEQSLWYGHLCLSCYHKQAFKPSQIKVSAGLF